MLGKKKVCKRICHQRGSNPCRQSRLEDLKSSPLDLSGIVATRSQLDWVGRTGQKKNSFSNALLFSIAPSPHSPLVSFVLSTRTICILSSFPVLPTFLLQLFVLLGCRYYCSYYYVIVVVQANTTTEEALLRGPLIIIHHYSVDRSAGSLLPSVTCDLPYK